MKKYLHTFNSGLICANKAACQLLCSSLLFCFGELNRFLEISVRDPRKILWVSRNSKLDPRNLVLEPRKSKLDSRASNSILDSRKLRGLRIEFWVETVNLHLSGTVGEGGFVQWQIRHSLFTNVGLSSSAGDTGIKTSAYRSPGADDPELLSNQLRKKLHSWMTRHTMILANDKGNNVVRLWQNYLMLCILLEGSIRYPPSDTQQAVNHPGVEFDYLARFLDLTLWVLFTWGECGWCLSQYGQFLFESFLLNMSQNLLFCNS